MILTPEEAKLVAAVLERTELRGAAEVRQAAACGRRLRWLLADAATAGADPGGAAELRGFCARLVADVMAGHLPISGAWAESILGIEARLAEPIQDVGGIAPADLVELAATAPEPEPLIVEDLDAGTADLGLVQVIEEGEAAAQEAA